MVLPYQNRSIVTLVSLVNYHEWYQAYVQHEHFLTRKTITTVIKIIYHNKEQLRYKNIFHLSNNYSYANHGWPSPTIEGVWTPN